MKNILPSSIFLLAVFFPSAALAESASVHATARILVTKYTVGDNIRVLIETETPKDYAVEPPSEKADFSPFEIKKVESSPIARGKNRVRRTFILNVTAFEKGTLTFPPVTVRWTSPQGRAGDVKTEPIEVEIVSVGRRPTDKEDIRGIKGPESFGWGPFRITTAAGLAALLFLVLAVKIFLRRFRRPVDDESTKPPHVRARLELERLKDKDLAGVADIFRRYLERRFGIDAMEKTTVELTETMKWKGMDRAFIEKVRLFLESADLIKFAKQEPTLADIETAKHRLLEMVEETTPNEIR